jgi:site-specific DNA recombinase
MPNTDGHSSKLVVLYARVSTGEQASSGYSLAQQLEALREYAADEGYEILEEVTDPGQSGVSLARPGLDRVRDLVSGDGVSVVLAQNRDRFSREPAYSYLLKLEFEEYGCKMMALNDRGDDSPEGQLHDGIVDQVAKYERAKTAERTRRGKLQKARGGKVIAGHTPKFGFRYNRTRDGYEVDETTMPIVKRVFRMVGAEGESLHAVKSTLEREGVPAAKGGRSWTRTFLRNVVLNDVYKPHTTDEMATLVSKEVAARLDENKRYGV